MAAGSTTAAALRHRPRQAVLIATLAAVVSASAVLGPLYSRAVEQSVLQTVLAEAPVQQRGLTAASTTNKPPSTTALTQRLELDQPGLGRPIGGTESAIGLTSAASPGGRGPFAGTAVLTSRDGLCQHLRLAAGTCPSGAGTPGVVVSRRNATAFGLTVGAPLRLSDANARGGAFTAVVAGIYLPFDASTTYWFGRGSGAVGSSAVASGQTDQATPFDTVYADESLLSAHRWELLRTHVDVPLDATQLRLDDLGALTALPEQLDGQARALGAAVTTGLPDLLAAVSRQRAQTRTVIPLLAVQLALLGVVVLGFVCAAATEVRRPEVALARLRGQGAAGTAGLLMKELGLLVVIGGVVGAAVGWLVAGVAIRGWLAPGVSLEMTGAVLVAALAAIAIGLLAVALTAAPTLRQPLVSLLRRVPPRASALQVGVVEGALVAATAAGVVTLFSAGRSGTGGSQGPVALLAPGLLAVAGGLLLAQVVVPVANPLARRAFSRGNVAAALAGTQVARRPALRRLIAIITVACALLVFAVDTWEVAARHRAALAGVETGAPVVLQVSARDARSLHDSVVAVDRRERFATPVATAGTVTGPQTTAVDPVAFTRIARWGGADRVPSPGQLAALRVARVPSIVLTGGRIEADVTGEVISRASDKLRKVAPSNILLHLTSGPTRSPVTVDLGVLRNGTRTYSAPAPCAEGCTLRRIEVHRTFGDFVPATVRVAVPQLRVGPATGAGRPVDLGPATEAAWQSGIDQFGNQVAALQPDSPVSFVADSSGESISVQRGDVPVVPPALAVGDVLQHDPTADVQDLASSPDLTGIDNKYRAVGRLPLVPRSGVTGVLVDLDQVADSAGPPTAFTRFSVWLAADDPGRERALVRRLAARGVVVTGRDTLAERSAALSRQGPTLALRLALLAGIVALALAIAALPIGAATSGSSRARDLAGLRVVGIPERAIRAAAVREHLVVAILGTIAGVTLGVIAAQAALPQVPLFVQPAPRLPVALDPAWGPVAVAAVAALVLLVVTSVLVGRSLAASASPDRLRGGR